MGKRIQKLMLKDLAKKTLYLGYASENIHTQIVIDCSEVFWDYPNATYSMNIQPPRGDKYPAAQLAKDGDALVWTVTDSDLIYHGSGHIQLEFKNDDEVIKSAVGTTKIDGSIETTGDVPTPLEDWMDQAEETAHQIALTAKDEVIEQIQDAAEEARESIPADYTQLSDDVSSLKSAFEQLNDNVIVDSAGPAPIVSVADGADGMPMRSVEVAIEPVQDLHGYDAPWPAGGGKNLLRNSAVSGSSNGITWTVNDDGSITFSGTASADVNISINNVNAHGYAPVCSGTQTLVQNNNASYNPSITGLNFQTDIYADGTKVNTLSNTVTSRQYSGVIAAGVSRLHIDSGTVIPSGTVYYPMIEIGSTPSTYAPYSNICPITGWTGAKVTRTGKNLCGGEAIKNALLTIRNASIGSDADGGYVSFTALNTANNQLFSSFKPDTQYTVVIRYKKNNTSLSNNLRIIYTDGTKKNIVTADTYEEGKLFTAIETSQVGKTISHIEAYYGSGTTSVYYDKCGLFEGVITEDQFESYQGQTYEVTFPDSSGAVYGGTLDVVSGKLVVDRIKLSVSDENKSGASLGWLVTDKGNRLGFPIKNTILPPSTIGNNGTDRVLCNVGKVSTGPNDASTFVPGECCLYRGSANMFFRYITSTDITSADDAFTYLKNIGAEFVSPIPAPVEISLTPTEIKTLLGENHLWADCGDSSITYPADTKMYIDNRINSTRRLIAGIETGFVASKPYAVGDMLIIGDDLYKVASAIASGATITVGTNVNKTTVAEQLIALANA